MIRPFTGACMLLAAGSGLWLYHVKHKAQVLDRRIEHTIRAADAARERTTMLRADWALLNDPQRLQELAATYLELQPIKPAQFVPFSDLDARLPPVPLAPVLAPSVIDAPEAVAQATPDTTPDTPKPDDTASVGSVAPLPAPKPTPPVKVAEMHTPIPAVEAAPHRVAPAPAPIRPHPPVRIASAAPRVVRLPPLRRVEALSVTPPLTRAYTGSVLGTAAPIHLSPPVPMVASYVNPVVVPDSR